MEILTVGHSNRAFSEFTDILSEHRVTLLVDVRSKPHSRWCPWFGAKYLEEHLPMLYIWRGKTLGGLDATIHPDDFDDSIEELILLSKRYRVCVMCSEKSPEKCHRTSKIGVALQKRRIKVVHIGI